MARPAAYAITDVERVAKQLKSQNKQATPYRVQKALGGGSFAWVKAALDQLGYQEDAGLPSGIDGSTAELIRLIQPLVDYLTKEARSDMDAAVDKLQSALDDKALEANQSNREKADSQRQLDAEALAHQESREQLAIATRKIGELEKSLAEETTAKVLEHTSAAQLREQLNDKERQIAALHADRQQLREEFAAERKAMRADHEADKSRMEQLRRDAVRDGMKERDSVQTLTRENAALVAERQALQRRLRELENELLASKNKLSDHQEKHQSEMTAFTKAITRLESSLEQTNKKAEDASQEAARAIQKLLSSQAVLQRHLNNIEHMEPLLPKEGKLHDLFASLVSEVEIMIAD
ncbi:hypothetical protein DOK_11656 [gamma proteobacterium BDW918]|nr:hypothetical protein DOK_11656 [gamma proteobacterium BDW918]